MQPSSPEHRSWPSALGQTSKRPHNQRRRRSCPCRPSPGASRRRTARRGESERKSPNGAIRSGLRAPDRAPRAAQRRERAHSRRTRSRGAGRRRSGSGEPQNGGAVAHLVLGGTAGADGNRRARRTARARGREGGRHSGEHSKRRHSERLQSAGRPLPFFILSPHPRAARRAGGAGATREQQGKHGAHGGSRQS